MDVKAFGGAYVAGIYEHPTRCASDLSLAQIYADVAKGALDDAGLTMADVDGIFCAGDAPGRGPLSLVDYLGLNVRHIDTTETGGSSYLVHVNHAVQAIAAGKCTVALIVLAGRPLANKRGARPWQSVEDPPEAQFETPYEPGILAAYAMCAKRHAYEYGTTSEQLAWIRVAASHHAQFNPHALLPNPVTVDDVLNSPIVADPLHRMDCCIISDGGGALVLVTEEIAKSLARPRVRVLGGGEAIKHQSGGNVDLVRSAAVQSGAAAFSQARVAPSDIKYASIYDSFTITVLISLEDLGFCEKGKGGPFVADGNLISGTGRLPFNTDGGGLCNNHPGNRGGMTKILEAVRQLRGEAHPRVQVKNCDLALAHGTGGSLGLRHGSATLILERE